jgi:hypothetical protein
MVPRNTLNFHERRGNLACVRLVLTALSLEGFGHTRQNIVPTQWTMCWARGGESVRNLPNRRLLNLRRRCPSEISWPPPPCEYHVLDNQFLATIADMSLWDVWDILWGPREEVVATPVVDVDGSQFRLF